MSAPVVAGAAALLLQINPNLTPNMVKAILMYTAQPLAGFNMFEQGAGQVNIEGAARLAKLVRTDLTSATPLGAPLLTTTQLPTPSSSLNGYSFPWSRGIILGRSYAVGTNLISKYQRIYDLGVVIGDAVVIGDGVGIGDGGVIGDATMLSDGVA